MKVLILGGTGQLGKSLLELSWPNEAVVSAPSRQDVDVTNLDSLQKFFDLFKPDYVINATAWTDVPGAESNPDGAMLLNCESVKYLAHLCKATHSTLVHVSTDYVFDGQAKVPYRETDQPNPLNNYGKSKLAGEKAIIDSELENYYIVRTSWLYSRFGKNFVKTIARRAINNESSAIADDQFGAPTFAGDLANAILSIVSLVPAPGIYHFSNSGKTNWYEFGKSVYELSGSDSSLVTSRKTELTELKRPTFSQFDLSKWSSAGLHVTKGWRDSLERELPSILKVIKEEG